MKLTEDPEKQTLPGSKAAFRLLGSDGEALPPRWSPWRPQAPALFLVSLPAHTGSPLLDLLQLAEEPPPQAGQELRVWPRGAQESLTVRPAHVELLLQLWVQDGQVTSVCTCNADRPRPLTLSQPLPSLFPQLCEHLPSLAESRAFAQLSLSRLSPAHRRLEHPEPYQVGGGPTWAPCPACPLPLLPPTVLSSAPCRWRCLRSCRPW